MIPSSQSFTFTKHCGRWLATCALAAAATALPQTAALAAEDVLIVYDASGSMWGQIDGVNKITIARDVMAELVQTWPADTNLGLVAYGHRNPGDCADIETLIAPQPLDREQFIATVNAINPKGKTPIADALQHAAQVLKFRDHNATVVLVSDGLESCHGDPCAVAAELEASGVDFTAHVVGFDLDDAGNEALACIADNTGGIFVPASNADELKDALQQVQTQVEKKQTPSQPEPEAEPEPEPVVADPDYKVTLSAPEQVTVGARFDVQWQGTVNPRDYYTIVPAGAKEGATGDWHRMGDKTEGQLVAPAQAGLYEVRYVLNEGGKTLASVDIEVIDAAVSITAPEQATVGARFDVQWQGTVNPRDYYTIVPAGAKEGATGDWHRMGDKTEGQLVAPAQAGLYEVRYVLNEGGKTLASVDIEVIDAEVAISAPDVVRAGTPLEVQWSSNVNPRDYYTMVPVGSPEGKTGEWHRVGSTTQGRLKAPETEGLYEVRYILNEGGKTLASAPVEVVAETATLDAGAGLQAPATAEPGETITVQWSGGSDGKDQRVALARADAPDFTWITAHKVSEHKSQPFTLPEEAGRYEIRYLDVSNKKVLGRAIVEVP